MEREESFIPLVICPLFHDSLPPSDADIISERSLTFFSIKVVHLEVDSRPEKELDSHGRDFRLGKNIFANRAR